MLPHPRFERRGADLYSRIRMPLTTALLGGEVEVPTLTGRVALRIPPETEDLQARLAELDELKRRIAELEERVDFTERLLARQREGERLQP